MFKQNPVSLACGRSVRAACKAFTLVEMLAVIAIIGVLGTAIGMALSGGSSSAAALGTAQRMVSGMFQAARTNAVMKGAETAVIIYKEGSGTTDPNKYLRFIGIVYKDSNGNWKPLNRGSYLPKGVYFSPPDGGAGTTRFAEDYRSSSNSLVTANSSFAFPVPAGGNDSWYVYSFDKNGNLTANSTYLLFTALDISGPPSGGLPSLKLNELSLEKMVGLAIRKTGGIIMLDYLNSRLKTDLDSGVNAMK